MILYPTPFIAKTVSPVTSGLIIQLDANNSSSYPGTGTTVFDITGSYNHTLIGATYKVLNGIKCFDCTTGNNRVNYNSTGPTLPTTGYTYITWTRLITSTAVFRTLLYTNGATKTTPITIPNGTNTLGYWDTEFRSSGYDVASDVWVQFAVVGDNSSQTFYINGSQVGTPIAFGNGGNTHWGWGNNDVVAQPWGYVANMYLYNRKLSLSEIIQQYSFLAPRFVIPTVSSLVLYYDPSNTASYPGTGVTMSNLASGGGLSGTLANISYTSPYLIYNGTSSQVSVVDNALLEPGTGDFTLEAWVYYSVLAGSTRTFISKTNNGGGSADWSYGFRTNGTTGAVYLEVGNGTTTVNSPTFTVTTGTWYQIVGVWTNVASNSIALYVNGASQGSNAHSFASVKNSTNPLYLGNYNGGEFSQWFNGRMGVVRMYNKALTGEEVLVNYVTDKGKYQ